MARGPGNGTAHTSSRPARRRERNVVVAGLRSCSLAPPVRGEQNVLFRHQPVGKRSLPSAVDVAGAPRPLVVRGGRAAPAGVGAAGVWIVDNGSLHAGTT